MASDHSTSQCALGTHKEAPYQNATENAMAPLPSVTSLLGPIRSILPSFQRVMFEIQNDVPPSLFAMTDPDFVRFVIFLLKLDLNCSIFHND